MKTITIAILVACLSFSILSAAPKLDQILSAPFPTSLVAAPAEDRVAWAFNEAGARNVWVAEGPEYKPRRLTNYREDDGQELSNLSFSGDASFVVYVRGGDPNAQQQHPNPTSNPAGAKQEVWAVKYSGGDPQKLGDGTSPVISPDGGTVAFVKSGQIFTTSFSKPSAEKQLFQARGQNLNPRWSPGGDRLAFVSYRGDHSFIGVFDLKQKSITWLSPDVDRDIQPVWSPDGKQIAFLRLPGQGGEPEQSWEPASTFSIRIADPSSGAGRTVWSSPDKTGGWAQYYPDQPLMWGAGDRLVFYWEAGGWLRMYSVPVSGGKEAALTPENCEAEHASLSPDRKDLFFNSNCEDIDRRHLWRVPVDAASAPRRLTQGNGIEWSPVVTSTGKQVLLLASNATQPAAPAAVPVDGGTPRLLAPDLLANVPVKDLVEPQQIVFKSMDGVEVHGQLFLPPSTGKETKHPALIFMHGGPIRQMLLGWHYMDYYHNAYGMNQYLAANGYAVLSVNFRCGIGYGRDFRRADKQGPYGASEYQDIVAAARLLQTRADVDPQRIGLWGGSYGGYLTALGLARDSQLFAAGVDFHGVHDWALRARLRGAEDWGIRGDEAMRRAVDSSPVADVSTWTSPVLFIIGDDDRNVDFIETTDLVQRLREKGNVVIETLIFPDEVHDLLCHRNWLRAYDATLDFFNRYLLPAP